MRKQTVAAVLAAIAALWLVVDVVLGGPALPGIIAGVMAILCLAIATERQVVDPGYDPELVGRTKRRYRVDLIIPLSPVLAPTLRTTLEEADVDVIGLELDVEHDEVIASIGIEATSREVAERVGVRTIARVGLVDDGVRAVAL